MPIQRMSKNDRLRFACLIGTLNTLTGKSSTKRKNMENFRKN